MSVTIQKRVNCRADSRVYADVSLTAVESSTDITSNTSTVTWSCAAAQTSSIRFTGTNRPAGATVDVYINGTHCMSKYIGLTQSPSSWTQGGSLSIGHNSDGTKSITVTLQITAGAGNYTNDPWTYGAASGSSTLGLTTLPRVSDISCGSLTLNSAGTITISRKASSFTDTVTYKFGSASGTITTKTGSTSVSFTPPLSLASQIPKAASGTMTITVTTYSGSTSIGSKSISVKVSVPSSVKPTVSSLTAAAVNGSVPSSWGIYVQTKSKAALTINGATGAYGSSITGYSIKGGGFTGTAATLTTGFLNTAGKITFTATVTDSRGRTSDAKTVTIEVQAYAAPVISAYSAQRCLAAGTLSDEGTCLLGNVTFTYSSCSSKNTVTTSTKYRKNSDTDFTDASAAFTSGTDFVFGDASISAESTYVVQFTVTDAFGSVSVNVIVSTAAVLLDFKAGGNGLAVGKVSETEKAFEVNADWNAYFHGEEIKDLIKTVIDGQNSAFQTLIKTVIDQQMTAIMEKAHPVGSVYISLTNTNPGTLFGGTWVQIAQGRFLIGQSSSYAAKATGGEATHTLSADEMPTHDHWVRYAGSGTGSQAPLWSGITGTTNGSIRTDTQGGSKAHNNMPPWYGAYMWERTK